MEWMLNFAVAFAIAVVLGIFLIPFLRKLKFGQSIREVGPDWHLKKSGTPTMGGIIFIVAYIISILLFNRSPQVLSVSACGVMFGFIGFADDYIKVVKKRNLGLTALQKFSAQFLVSVAFLLYLMYTGSIDTSITIPFAGKAIDIGLWFIPFVIFVMLGTVNSVNLTDGLDGLAGSVTLIVALFFALAARKLELNNMSIQAAALSGAIVGFLLYNLYPAKVFMGDTGSLFLGGIISAMAISMGIELILIVCGAVYVVEAASVIIQVTSFKLTGKRVFKMSPIHHHFEMCGYTESKIVLTFTMVTLVLCAISYLAF